MFSRVLWKVSSALCSRNSNLCDLKIKEEVGKLLETKNGQPRSSSWVDHFRTRVNPSRLKREHSLIPSKRDRLQVFAFFYPQGKTFLGKSISSRASGNIMKTNFMCFNVNSTAREFSTIILLPIWIKRFYI